MYPPKVISEARRLDAERYIRGFDFHVFTARVYLAECAYHRHDPVWRDFYWIMYGWAQHARREALRSEGYDPRRNLHV